MYKRQVYSYGKTINVAERAAGKYNIGADLASEKYKKLLDISDQM